MQIFSLAAVLAALPADPVAPSMQSAATALVAQSSSVPGASGAQGTARPASDRAGARMVTAPFGAKDSWRWQVLGSWMGDFDGADQLEAEWSASWFFVENLSLDFGVSGDAILQPGTDAGGGGASLMMRWHFLARAEWSLFADIGCGLLFTNEPVPSDGGRVNFTPRAGLGGTIDVGGGARLMAGARWYHISNANTGQDNPGRDSLQVFGGVSFPF